MSEPKFETREQYEEYLADPEKYRQNHDSEPQAAASLNLWSTIPKVIGGFLLAFYLCGHLAPPTGLNKRRANEDRKAKRFMNAMDWLGIDVEKVMHEKIGIGKVEVDWDQ